MRRALLLLALCLPATAQIVQLTGGQSTLFQGAGGGITAYLPGSTMYLGGGCTYGHCAAGLADTFAWRGWNVTAGDSGFGYALDGAGLSTQVRGLNFARVRPQDTTAFFVGSAALGYNAPYFSASRAQHVGFGLFYRRKLGRWQLGTLEELNGGKRTAVQGVTYTSPALRLAVTGGILDNARLLNALADYQPTHALHFGASHVNYFYPQHVTSDSASASMALGHFSAMTSVQHATAAGRSVSGAMLGADTHYGPVSLQANWYRAAGTQALTQTLQERAGRHWTFAQTFSEQGGRTSFGAGGGYRSNSVSVSVDHSMMFLAHGWQQVTSVTLSFRIPHTDASVTVGTAVLPTGQTKYTVSGQTWAHGPLNLQAAGPQHPHHVDKGGRYIVRGKVIDRAGLPVTGAAVALGSSTVFSDGAGMFSTRLRKATPVFVHVLTDQFAVPGTWVVISCPDVARPDQPITIVASMN